MGAIVLGYDASPGAKGALDCAIDLAREHGDELVIAHGVAPPASSSSEPGERARCGERSSAPRLTSCCTSRSVPW